MRLGGDQRARRRWPGLRARRPDPEVETAFSIYPPPSLPPVRRRPGQERRRSPLHHCRRRRGAWRACGDDGRARRGRSGRWRARLRPRASPVARRSPRPARRPGQRCLERRTSRPIGGCSSRTPGGCCPREKRGQRPPLPRPRRRRRNRIGREQRPYTHNTSGIMRMWGLCVNGIYHAKFFPSDEWGNGGFR